MIVLIGFFSKQFVLYSALQNGYYFISLIAIIVSVISASYYLKIIKVLHTFEDNEIEANKAPSLLGSLPLTNGESIHRIVTSTEPGVDNNLDSSLCEDPSEMACASDSLYHYIDKNSDTRTRSYLPIIYGESKYTLTNTHSFLISSLTLIILLFFIKPSIILNSTQLLSLSLFYI